MNTAEFKKQWVDVKILTSLEEMMYRFAMQNHRAPTVPEMRWLRMRHDSMKLVVTQREYAMAASRDGFNERIERSAADTHVFEFSTNGGMYHVAIEVTAIPDEDPEVAIKMEDQNGNAVPHGHVIFPGADISVEMDDGGWQTISYVDYEKYIQTVMRLQCSVSEGEPMELTMQ